MSNKEALSFDEGYTQLKKELASGTVLPAVKPTTLDLKSIRMAHSVFQPRDFDEGVSSDEHVRTLLNALIHESNNTLDPITVWWSGKHWRVIDGHHRVKAYAALEVEKKLKPRIPVVIFEGTPLEAIFEATRLNSKDKLAMSVEDKVNRAWKLVLIGSEFSKKLIARTCSIGTSTVGRMRSKLVVIREDEPEDWLEVAGDMTWKEAQRYGEAPRDYDEEWQDKRVLVIRKRLDKAFGKTLVRQPELFARAIEAYSPKLYGDLEEYLRPYEPNDDF